MPTRNVRTTHRPPKEKRDTSRITDPLQVPVQINVRIPWQLRQDMDALCEKERYSINGFIAGLIEDAVRKSQRKETVEADES